jgi:hypothetical protein
MYILCHEPTDGSERLDNEGRGLVVNTPASYSRGSRFKYWPGDLLS